MSASLVLSKILRNICIKDKRDLKEEKSIKMAASLEYIVEYSNILRNKNRRDKWDLKKEKQ